MTEPLDELISLYRLHAHETAPRRLDTRILRAADRADTRRRAPHLWAWVGTALAASLLGWVAVRDTSYVEFPFESSATHPLSLHVADDSTRGYLLHMNVHPQVEPVTAYLLSDRQTVAQTPSSHND